MIITTFVSSFYQKLVVPFRCDFLQFNNGPVLVYLISFICKLFEVCHFADLYLITNKVFIPEQFGSWERKSCPNNYLRFTIGLSSKIHAHDIRGPHLSWLKYFLTSRYHRVILRGDYSLWTSVFFGVYKSPQNHLCGNHLETVSEVKDLGIHITLNLS